MVLLNPVSRKHFVVLTWPRYRKVARHWLSLWKRSVTGVVWIENYMIF